MPPARRTAAILSFVFLSLSLSLLQTEAHAGRPWSDRGDNRGNKQRNKAPTIQGTPSTFVEVDEYYAFQASGSDRDGDVLTFSILNKPAWAAFDTAKGFLSGFPGLSDAGTVTRNVTISVSDGRHTVSLAPFDITVGTGANSPPVISGSPPTEVLANQAYSFTPGASDPDGDALIFRIANQPAWASFDTSSGTLRGTPGEAHVGVYENVRITVTDGSASASTNPFSISVVQTAGGSITLSWIAPTQNEDGSPLTDLAGYRIHYGTAPGQYDHRLEIAGAGVLTIVIGDLTPGTWYFAATAFTSSGLESAFSSELQHSVP